MKRLIEQTGWITGEKFSKEGAGTDPGVGWYHLTSTRIDSARVWSTHVGDDGLDCLAEG